jgi:hypothetical protein
MVAALEAAAPALEAAGIDHRTGVRAGCPYISHARADLLRAALDAGADDIVFIDHDVSFTPTDLVRLVQTQGDVVAGTYRYKKAEEEYMGALLCAPDGFGHVRRADGCASAHSVPAGFLKITAAGVAQFMRAYPELVFGAPFHPSIDLFNHGAHEGVWYGEDMAFCRRWRAMGGEIWLLPDLDLTHHSETAAYPGNFDRFMRRQPGGDLDPAVGRLTQSAA